MQKVLGNITVPNFSVLYRRFGFIGWNVLTAPGHVPCTGGSPRNSLCSLKPGPGFALHCCRERPKLNPAAHWVPVTSDTNPGWFLLPASLPGREQTLTPKHRWKDGPKSWIWMLVAVPMGIPVSSLLQCLGCAGPVPSHLLFPGSQGSPCRAWDHAGAQGDHLDCSHSRRREQGMEGIGTRLLPGNSLGQLVQPQEGARDKDTLLMWEHPNSSGDTSTDPASSERRRWQLNRAPRSKFTNASFSILSEAIMALLLGMSQSQWEIKIKRLRNPVCKSLQNNKILSKMDYRD